MYNQNCFQINEMNNICGLIQEKVKYATLGDQNHSLINPIIFSPTQSTDYLVTATIRFIPLPLAAESVLAQ